MLKYKLIRTSTVPISLKVLLKGQLSYLNNDFEVIALSSPGKELKEIEIQEGIKTFPIKMERKISPIKDLISIFKMTVQLRELKPTIIHSITPKAGLVSMISAKLAGVPIRIHTFTGLIFPTATGLKKIILKNVDRVICYCATDIIPEGNGVRKDLIENKITNKELQIIGNGNVNGIDLEYFSKDVELCRQANKIRQSLLIKDSNFVFSFIGRIVEDKGIIELLEAFENVQKRYINTHLIIAGPFEEDSEKFNSRIINRFKIIPNIHWMGFVSDIRPILVASNVLVLPSYREGFPNVVIQAGAMDLPCVVTDISGCNEIIKNDINGLIVPPKNVYALENALLELIIDDEKRKLLAQNARPLIVERYEQQKVWQLIKQKYIKQLKEANIIT